MNPATHKHEWKDSREALGLVGSLYPAIYPVACICGAIGTASGEVILPKRNGARNLLIEKPKPKK